MIIDTFGWQVRDKIYEEIESMSKGSNQSYYKLIEDDVLIQQIADKLIKVYGAGPHDITGKAIDVGDSVVVARERYRAAVMGLGTVKSIKKQTVTIEWTNGGTYNCRDSKRIYIR